MGNGYEPRGRLRFSVGALARDNSIRGEVVMAGRQPWLNRDDILQQVMELFWEGGYEGTSITDLIRHLDMHATSIYRMFGSKHELYLAAIRLYKRQQLAKLIGELNDENPLGGIDSLLREWASGMTDEHRRGCFMVNAAVEHIPRDQDIAAEISRFWDRLEGALTETLTCARDRGELDERKDPAAAARFLLAVMHGMSVTGKVDPDGVLLRSIAATTIQSLRPANPAKVA
jgi:TetR/AcrR family transcriptional regulator, transcriptional repressor for nem operon